jgi:hypothetical protein
MPLQAILPRVRFRNPSPDVVVALNKWKGDVIRDMKFYPAQRPHVTYKRKGGQGGYASHWKFETKRDEALVFNNAEYAEFLGGDDPPKGTAARWARPYGWPALRKVSKRHNERLVALLGKKLTTAIKFSKV